MRVRYFGIRRFDKLNTEKFYSEGGGREREIGAACPNPSLFC